MKKIVLGCMFVVMFSGVVSAMETKAKSALLMDYDTGDYLYTKEHQKMVPPASMSKLMTLYMLMDKLKKGDVSLDDTFKVSENAWRKGGAATGGSTMFLAIGDTPTVEDLMKGIIIQSGNDACIVTAENLAGSEEEFVEQMNKKAKEMGMNNSHFENSTGLPHPDHKMSMEDLAILSKHIIKDFPEYYHFFSQKNFVYNNIKQGNRNPLLYSMDGADGLKTGHTEEAGFSLTASVKKGARRLIGAMSGMGSMKERSEETEKLMSWGFREFKNYKIVEQGKFVKEVPVWMGVKKTVKMVAADEVFVTLRKSDAADVKLVASYNVPVKAPVKKGDKIGALKVNVPERYDIEIPLVADEDVMRKGLFSRIVANIRYVLFGVQ